MTPGLDLLSDTGQLQPPTGGMCWMGSGGRCRFIYRKLSYPFCFFSCLGGCMRNSLCDGKIIESCWFGFFLDIPQSCVLFTNSCQRKEVLLTRAFFGSRVGVRLLPQQKVVCNLSAQIWAFHISFRHNTKKNHKALSLQRVNGLDLTSYVTLTAILREQHWTSSLHFLCSNPHILVLRTVELGLAVPQLTSLMDVLCSKAK